MSTMDFVTAAVLAPAVGAAAFTIARTKVTEPFRARVGAAHSRWVKENTPPPPVRELGAPLVKQSPALLDTATAPLSVRASKWLSTLVGCPYCLSHWLSWGAVAVYRPRLVHAWLPLDLFTSSWPIIAGAMLTAGLLAKAMKA